MIQLNDLTYSYNKERIIFKNKNYTFNDFGLYSVVARSGYGKTTLLKLIASLLQPTGGNVLYSSDIVSNPNSISFISLYNNSIESLTVYENISLMLKIKNIVVDDYKIDHTLDKFGLISCKNVKADSLSGGERQRLCILISVLSNSKVIIADEPFSSLDESNALKMMEIYKELSKEKLVIVASHNKKLIKNYSDFIIDLENDDLSEKNKENDNLFESIKNNKLLKIKDVLYIYNKIFKGNIIQFIFSVLLFAVLSTFLFLVFLSTQFDSTIIYPKVIKAKEYDYFILRDGELNNTTIDNDFKNEYNYIMDDLLSLDDFPDYKYMPSNLYFHDLLVLNYVISDDFENNHISITDCIAYTLRYYNILSFNDLNEVSNQHLKTKYFDLIIDDVRLTSFSYNFINENETGSNLVNSFIIGNFDLYKSLCYEKNKIDFYICKEIQSRFNIEVDDNLNDDDIIISTNALSRININAQIGDVIDLTCYHDDLDVEAKFKVKEIIVDNYFPVMKVSKSKYLKLNNEWVENYGKDNFRVGLFFNHPDIDTITNVNKKLKNNNLIITNFNFYSEAQFLVNQLAYFKEYSVVFLFLILIVSIIWITYLMHSRHKVLDKTFMILEINGLSKINQFIIFNLEYFYQILGSLLLSAVNTIVLTILINKKINKLLNYTIDYNCFSIKYVVFSYLTLILLILINIIIIYWFYYKKKKKYSY